MSEVKQIHLVGDGLSYRGVRFTVPDPDDLDEVMISIAREASGDASRFIQMIPRLMLQRCIVAVTDPGVGKAEAEKASAAAMITASHEAEAAFTAAQKRGASTDELRTLATANAVKVATVASEAALAAAANVLIALPPASWLAVTAESMMVKGTPKSFARLFGTKDYSTLRSIIQRYYDSRALDAELIVGKALTVSTD